MAWRTLVTSPSHAPTIFRYLTLECLARPRDRHASLGKQSSGPVGQCRALLDQQLAHAMDHLDLLMLDRLHSHEVHRRATQPPDILRCATWT